MTPSDETLRRRFEQRDSSAEAGPCPSAQEMLDAAASVSSPAARAAIAAHAVDCAACAAELRVLRALHAGAREAAGPAAPVHRPLRRLAWVAAAAAVAAAAVTITLWRRSPDRGREPVLRAEPGDEIQSTLPPGAMLPRDQLLLRWTGQPGARYEVTVAREDLTPIASARDLREPSYQVDASRLAGLSPGSPVLWNVVAVLPDGRRLASTTFVTRVK